MLSANTYISEVVLPEERTAAFGVLQGFVPFSSPSLS